MILLDRIVCSFVLCCLTLHLAAQDKPAKLNDTSLIDSLMAAFDYKAAQTEIDQQIAYYKSAQQPDSLVKYIRFVGNPKLSNNNWETAIKKAENYVAPLAKGSSPTVAKNAYLDLANLYDEKGDPDKAFDTTLKALEMAEKIESPKKAKLEGIYYNLGRRAFNKGDIALSKKYQLKNLRLRKKNKDENYEMYYMTYNTMGRLMWYSGQPDSALFYFRESIQSIQQLDSTLENRCYRPALVNGNIAVILQSEGEIEKAIDVTKNAINQLNTFYRLSADETKKHQALKQKLLSIDNLGAYYNSLGEFSQAEDLIAYSYSQKQKYFDKGDINITISQILLGQAKISNQKPSEAKQLLLKAIERLGGHQSTNVYYRGFAYTSLGNIYKAFAQNDSAAYYFSKAEKEFRTSMNGDYTKDFLDVLANMALFYSKTGNGGKAQQLTDEAWNFTQHGDFKNSLQSYRQLLNRAEVNYNLGKYQVALGLSKEGLNFLKTKLNKVSHIDSIQIQYHKPRNLLLLAKSKYQLQENKNEAFYLDLLQLMQEGLDVLNQRKTTLNSYEDLSGLIEENDEIFQFYMKLSQELYSKTHNKAYLNQLITLHESSIYTRIRTRLNFRDMAFANVNAPVLKREKQLKSQLRTALKEGSSGGLSHFFHAQQSWAAFLDSLKQAYPNYYNMRYATITGSLGQLHQNIPEQTTIVRYLFVGDSLFAFVADQKQQELVALDFRPVQKQIAVLHDPKTNFEQESIASYQLYQNLWKSLEQMIHTSKVIIFPDKDLFNLSFEMLTPEKIHSFEDFATKSLLSKYSISYNYSLFLLGGNKKTITYKDDFIAYAPVFNKQMKDDYKLAITDSINLDKTYLTLIPQPFSADLIQKFSHTFDGNSFLDNRASKQIFTKTAREHKIIHIGTHAESNNVSPELSRLVFAKNLLDSAHINDNSLYTYEIYNCNLNSKLAILTACETGKPSYQAGEGMISLAHAFNYAGSESILTSLWKIDEQSSAEIIELFYDYLLKGLPKDEALQKAKLDYLISEEGRKLQPEYWAGLILMGNTDAIAISPHFHWFILSGVLISLCLILLVVLFRKRKRRTALL